MPYFERAQRKENCIMTSVEKRYSVIIKPKEWTFEAAGTMSLLASANLSGFLLPSSCRNGTCRTCMCRMRSGQVRYGIEWPGLSADEKKDGYILPCVAYPESDVIIDLSAI